MIVAISRWAGIAVSILLLLAMLWLVWPARVKPQYWDEPEPPALTGVLEPGAELAGAHALCAEICETTVEAVLPLEAGRFLVGQDDGVILLLDANESAATPLARLSGGRVKSMAWMLDGRIAATTGDALHAVNLETGVSSVISRGVPGRPFGFINSVAAAPDGRLYFTDSTFRWDGVPGETNSLDDMLENRPHGRLYSWDPSDGRTRLVADRLYFPNGVAVSSDGQSVFVAETWRYTIRRHWIAGPRQGRTEILTDNLPGLPDGLWSDGAGRLYIAMGTPRLPSMAWMHRHPWLVEMITKLPRPLWNSPDHAAHQGFIMLIDEMGGWLGRYDAPDSRWGILSNIAVSADGSIVFGALNRAGFGVYRPDTPIGATQAEPQGGGESGPVAFEERD